METPETGSSTKKRKLGDQVSVAARKKACNAIERKRSWGYSTDLMLYDDPWKIKKVLQESDLGGMSRLLLPKGLAEDLVLPVLGADAQRNAENERGIEVSIWDVDTKSMHGLVFKRWGSSRCYVFIGNWVKDFVNRRSLKRGDEIGLHWNPFNSHFNFSVLKNI